MFTSQTPKSLNRSNPNLATIILKISKNNVIFGLFGLLFVILKFWEFSNYFEKFSLFFWCSDMGISRQWSDLGVWLVNLPPSAVANEIGSPQNSTVAGHARAHRRPKWVPHYGVQVDSGRAQAILRALLKLCSGSAQVFSPSIQACSPSTQAYSPSTQVKAAAAQAQRLKQN